MLNTARSENSDIQPRVLRSGQFFMPIARAADAVNCAYILAHRSLLSDSDMKLFVSLDIDGIELWLSRSDPSHGAAEPAFAEVSEALAYQITTSGTVSGTPTLVRVPRSCIAPNIASIGGRIGMTSSDVLLLAAPPVFDPCIVELFTALSASAHVVIVPESIKRAPRELASVISEFSVSVLMCTPTLFRRYVCEQIRPSAYLVK